MGWLGCGTTGGGTAEDSDLESELFGLSFEAACKFWLSEEAGRSLGEEVGAEGVT